MVRFPCRKPPRFRPGWTNALDRLAKEHTSLLQTGLKENKLKDTCLDKAIKANFRGSLRNMRAELGYIILRLTQQQQDQKMSRLLKQKSSPISTNKATVNSDHYTMFMSSRQTRAEDTARVTVLPFKGLPCFRYTQEKKIQSASQIPRSR